MMALLLRTYVQQTSRINRGKDRRLRREVQHFLNVGRKIEGLRPPKKSSCRFSDIAVRIAEQVAVCLSDPMIYYYYYSQCGRTRRHFTRLAGHGHGLY